MRVKILFGFAEGLEGEITRTYSNGDYEVILTYPEGFSDGMYDLSGQTERLFYCLEEVQALEEGE